MLSQVYLGLPTLGFTKAQPQSWSGASFKLRLWRNKHFAPSGGQSKSGKYGFINSAASGCFSGLQFHRTNHTFFQRNKGFGTLYALYILNFIM